MATSDTLSQQLSELRLARGASHFHPFPRLPLELRRIVWGLCRPHRIVDLDYTLSPEDLLTACRGVQRTSTLNSKPPIISRVCRESREVALQGMEAPVFEDTVPSSENHVCIRHNYWFNSSTDLIHLNVSIRNPSHSSSNKSYGFIHCKQKVKFSYVVETKTQSHIQRSTRLFHEATCKIPS
jgi:hypothetical protein